MPLKLLIVDDEPLAREGLRMLLAGDPDVEAIGEAKDGREAVGGPARDAAGPRLPRRADAGDGRLLAWSARSAPEHMPAVVFVTAHDGTRSRPSRSTPSTTCSSRSPASASPRRSPAPRRASRLSRRGRRAARSSPSSRPSPRRSALCGGWRSARRGRPRSSTSRTWTGSRPRRTTSSCTPARRPTWCWWR